MNRKIVLAVSGLIALAAAGGGYYWVNHTAAGYELWYVTLLGETAEEHALRHADTEFTCPMHPEVREDEPGDCPICGMELVPVDGAAAEETAEPDEDREILYWVAPMDPSYRRDEPGQSPMGMDLVPVYADQVDDRGGVALTPRVIKRLGVRTSAAEERRLQPVLNATGTVTYNEEAISHVHLRTRAWIENLAVRAEGERIEQGKRLFDVYAPDLVNAQEELLNAHRHGRERVIEASRSRLRALGMDPETIQALERDGEVRQWVPVHARQSGVVAELNVREGMYVEPGTQVMSLVDLSEVWVIADFYESQAGLLREDLAARVDLIHRPGNAVEGSVDYVYPSLERTTRSVRARLRFDNGNGNGNGEFKPGMYARVMVEAEPLPAAVTVPREAVIRTGREDRVILHLDDGYFQPQSVTLGPIVGDRAVIRDGLNAGEEVVTSGQFLLDSETQVRAGLQRLATPDDPVERPESHTGTGVINRIDAEAGTVNLTHEPIPSLDWPEMTMDFHLSDPALVDDFAAGDEVRFTFHEDEEGRHVITDIEPAATAYEGVGVLHEVDTAAREVDLTHDPIPALDWPEMRMGFRVAEDVPLDEFSADNAVEFRFVETADGAYEIIEMEPAS